MKLSGMLLVSVIALAVLFMGCTSQQLLNPPSNQSEGNQTPSGVSCILENNLCGYGTAAVNTLVVNQSHFYGRCCQGFACVNGYCRKSGEQCVASNQLCGYGPINLAHYDTPTYYGECCEADCVDGYCKPTCKTSGSCSNSSNCCSGYECREGQCRTPCKTTGSCSNNTDCCTGYNCSNNQCTKMCKSWGTCATNIDCCSGYYCGSNMNCMLEPTCVPHRGSCNSTNRCCTGLSCVDGACTNESCKWGIACNSTLECCTGLYCGQTGICNIQHCTEIGSSCNKTDDCCVNNKCENSTCVQRTCTSLNESCTSLSCCSGLTCMNYKCQVPCKISGVCFKDSDCCGGYYCSPAGYCAKQPTCTLESGSCLNDSDCCAHLMCNGGTCTKPCKKIGTCNSNADCCVGFFCNVTMQCAQQPTEQPTTLSCASTYPTCAGACTSDWCYATTNGCACGAVTNSSCLSLCGQYYYAFGRRVHIAAECSAQETYMQGCCCSQVPPPPPPTNWYCCRNPIGNNMCWSGSCPLGYTQQGGYFGTLASCQAYCNNIPQCTRGTAECAAGCRTLLGVSYSTCAVGSCPSGYTQLQDVSCSQYPPCDRCCCQAPAGGLYDAYTCHIYSQNLGYTHSQLTLDGHYWDIMGECFNNATAHCQQFHNGAPAPNGGASKNCCYWYCLDERPPGPT